MREIDQSAPGAPISCILDHLDFSGNLWQESMLFSGVNWKIILGKEAAFLDLTGAELAQALLVQESLKAAAHPAIAHKGMAPAHLETMLFISHRWSDIVRTLRTSALPQTEALPLPDAQIYTEVNLRLPYFGGEQGHTLDCVGNDKQGNFYVIEIGRGNKSDQLARQLYLAQTVFPKVPFYGVVAKYTQVNATNCRLFLRFI